MFLLPENGTQRLDWVETAHIIPDGEGGFNFTYLLGENDTTIWPGEMSINIKRQFCYLPIFYC